MAKPVLFLVASCAALLASSVSATPQAIASCNADKIKEAMNACDSLANISEVKCENTACHKALHLLVDPEYIACYEELKLGKKEDLAKYKELDDFCHGDGHDPLEEGHEDHDHEGHDHDDHDDHEHGNSTSHGSGSKAAADKKNDSVSPAAPSTVPSPTPTNGAAAMFGVTTVATLMVAAAALL